ncbi:type B 50S ribosomal protein L31 [Actinomycetospora atypica]|uniref:50S ribosomal protein L31 n=1 Tax=Actinomycetospora atypica TaxID=1290095 RepID=A0ABV9YF51_9PSEU
MKRDLHPEYGPVVVRDQTSGETFLTRSTIVGTRRLPTITWTDGETYPVLDVEISSSSHPVWTGTARPIERGGQIEKFQRRYGRTR